MVKILIVIVLIWLILLADLTIETKKWKFEYNGLIWVALDAYSIYKYHSDDSVMPFIKITHLK